MAQKRKPSDKDKLRAAKTKPLKNVGPKLPPKPLTPQQGRHEGRRGGSGSSA